MQQDGDTTPVHQVGAGSSGISATSCPVGKVLKSSPEAQILHLPTLRHQPKPNRIFPTGAMNFSLMNFSGRLCIR